ncbi:signal peptidase complex subunit 1 [Chytriomyces sp. MP71]|nr:signal peptidase complex subunit 1 [Chytriomyces sp. MP71]KAI8610865.1 signal peptidase complex subunit 1 [Chytriomyces sp. MP71]
MGKKKEALVDFRGQMLADRIFKAVLTLFGMASFLAGFYAQSLQVTVAVNAAGLLIALILTVPPWPFLRAHPIKWLPKVEKPEIMGLAKKEKPWWMKLLF